MSNEMQAYNQEAFDKVVIQGDLSKLTAAEKTAYYLDVCNALGLNPVTRPFDYIKLQGKETLYARKDATEQLRSLRKISISEIETKIVNDIYIVIAHANTADGRADIASGAVSIKGLSGDALANALMKAETKAKRRATLSIAGLGVLDETEIETIPSAERVVSSPTSYSSAIRDTQAAPKHLEVETRMLTDDEKEAVRDAISLCITLDDLKIIFKDTQRICKNDPDFLAEVIKLKDSKKVQIELDTEAFL